MRSYPHFCVILCGWVNLLVEFYVKNHLMSVVYYLLRGNNLIV